MKFKELSFTVPGNQPGMLPDKHTAQYTVENSEILK
jgi:hypothetical protein